jgi:hypothetical protein
MRNDFERPNARNHSTVFRLESRRSWRQKLPHTHVCAMPNPTMQDALSTLATEMADIGEEHEEITDTDIRERMFDVIFQGFIYRTPGYQAPQFYNTDTPECNVAVRAALTKFIEQANLAADASGLDTPQKRHDAFNAADLDLDEYFGYSDELHPPSPPIGDQPGDMDRYNDEE